ncbi:MAG: peptidyl-alpha-hydroxyglycine alpha-amidating lyase family protein [Nitrososphaeria archaeon]
MPFGQGKYVYEVVEGWGKHFYSPFVEVTGIATDSQDRIYILTRGLDPVLIFDSEGNFIKCWGREYASWPHGICVGKDGLLYVADGDHTVKKLTPNGELVMTLGKRNQPSDTGCANKDYRTIMKAAGPFNYPTDVAVDKDGTIYVSDGYGNARIHKFSEEGELMISWGEPGREPGQFNLPHGVAVSEGIVYVADRENSRIQLFDTDGGFLEEWPANRPTDVVVYKGKVIVTELGYNIGARLQSTQPKDGVKTARLSILTLDGTVLSRWGTDDCCAPGSFKAPHALCVDTKGSIYVGEVVITSAEKPGTVPGNCHTLQKFVQVS